MIPGIFATDIDGTAILSKEAYAQCMKEHCENKGVEVSIYQIMDAIRSDKILTAKNLYDRFPQLSVESWLQLVKNSDNPANHRVEVRQGLYEFYRFLWKKLGPDPINRFYAVSSSSGARINSQIDQTIIYQEGDHRIYLGDFFLPSHRILKEYGGELKPAPGPYLAAKQQAVRKLGADNVSYVFTVEDDRNGMIAAHEAGNIIWVIPGDAHIIRSDLTQYADYVGGGYPEALEYFSRPGNWPPKKQLSCIDITRYSPKTSYSFGHRSTKPQHVEASSSGSMRTPSIVQIPAYEGDIHERELFIYHKDPLPSLAETKHVSIVSLPNIGDSTIIGGMLPKIFTEQNSEVVFFGPKTLEHLLGDLPSISAYRELPFTGDELNRLPISTDTYKRFEEFYHRNREFIDSSEVIIMPALMNGLTHFLSETSEAKIIERLFGEHEPISDADNVITIARMRRSLCRYQDYNILPFAGFQEFPEIVHQYWNNTTTEIAIPPVSETVLKLVSLAKGRDIIVIDPAASTPEKMWPLHMLLSIVSDNRLPPDTYFFVINGYDPYYRNALNTYLANVDHVIIISLSLDEKVALLQHEQTTVAMTTDSSTAHFLMTKSIRESGILSFITYGDPAQKSAWFNPSAEDTAIPLISNNRNLLPEEVGDWLTPEIRPQEMQKAWIRFKSNPHYGDISFDEYLKIWYPGNINIDEIIQRIAH